MIVSVFRRSSLLGFLTAGGVVFFCSIFLSPQAFSLENRNVRVLIYKGNNLRIRSDGKASLFFKNDNLGVKKIRGLKIRKKDGVIKLFLEGRSGRWLSLVNGEKIRISTRDRRGIWLGKRRYRGKLWLNLVGNQIYVVNHIDIEKYLESVVASEMPKLWPKEALKAQAVAARTYALKQLGKRRLYDLTASEKNQVYLGIESETPTTVQAVRDTKSLVITYKRKLINAVFHSGSGGHTESSGEVWKYSLPYLIGVKDYDHKSPKYEWNMRFGPKHLHSLFPETNGVKQIKLLKLSSTGRIISAEVIGPSKNLIVSGKELRGRMGLKSTLVRFKLVPVTHFSKDISNGFALFSLPASVNIENKPLSTTLRKSKGFWRDWTTGGETIYDKRLPLLTAPPRLDAIQVFNPSKSLKKNALPSIPSNNNDLVLLARGYGAGHGVGLSQWGSKYLAHAGASFRMILKHYYSDVEITSYNTL